MYKSKLNKGGGVHQLSSWFDAKGSAKEGWRTSLAQVRGRCWRPLSPWRWSLAVPHPVA